MTQNLINGVYVSSTESMPSHPIENILSSIGNDYWCSLPRYYYDQGAVVVKIKFPTRIRIGDFVIVWEHYPSDYNIMLDNMIVYEDKNKRSMLPTNLCLNREADEITINLNKLGNGIYYGIWYVKISGEVMSKETAISESVKSADVELSMDSKSVETEEIFTSGTELEELKRQNKFLAEALLDMRTQLNDYKDELNRVKDRTILNETNTLELRDNFEYSKIGQITRLELDHMKYDMSEQLDKKLEAIDNELEKVNKRTELNYDHMISLETSLDELKIKCNGEYSVLNSKMRELTVQCKEAEMRFDELEYDLDNDLEIYRKLVDELNVIFNGDIASGCRSMLDIMKLCDSERFKNVIYLVEQLKDSFRGDIVDGCDELIKLVNMMKDTQEKLNDKFIEISNNLLSQKQEITTLKNAREGMVSTINTVRAQGVITSTKINHINKELGTLKHSSDVVSNEIGILKNISSDLNHEYGRLNNLTNKHTNTLETHSTKFDELKQELTKAHTVDMALLMKRTEGEIKEGEIRLTNTYRSELDKLWASQDESNVSLTQTRNDVDKLEKTLSSKIDDTMRSHSELQEQTHMEMVNIHHKIDNIEEKISEKVKKIEISLRPDHEVKTSYDMCMREVKRTGEAKELGFVDVN